MTSVAVIGGGIAGASVGYELAVEADVVLLERESVCGYHATGRSAALFTECYGDEVVRRLALASRRFFESPPPGFADQPLAGQRGLLFIGRAGQRVGLEQAHDRYRALVPAVRALGTEEVLEACPVLDPQSVIGGILEPDARDLDVHALHLGYQRGLRARGGRILTDSPVTGLHSRGDRWLVETPGGSHRVDVVVDAAGAWGDPVAILAGASPIGLVPKRRTAFTFRPPEGVAHGGWPMVLDVDETFYFKPEGARLLASPADETPMEPGDVRHEEVDVAIAIERISQLTTLSIRSVEHAWAGLRTFASDHRPVNGWDPVVPGFYWLVGQGGFGIKTAPAMARFSAGMILEGRPPADLVDAGLTTEVLGPLRFRTERP